MSFTARLTQSSVGSPLINQAVPLADKNWFQTGGHARYFSEPITPEAFQEVLSYGAAHKLPICLIGEGANILVSDEGYDGLVIRPQLTHIKRYDYDQEYACVEAHAGVSFAKLISWCLENNLLVLEEFSGIRVTVGVCVYINIIYFLFLLMDVLIGG